MFEHAPMPDSRDNPRNADLPTGRSKTAIQENCVPRLIQEKGDPEISAPVWHSRGYLPHFESSETAQHVTFHLADSLPQPELQRLAAGLKSIPRDKRDVELRKQVDAWIDAGHGSCALRKPAIASMVQGSLLTFDSQRYRLLAWVVMPNHVHALFQPINEWTVRKIVAAWKKFTARKICDHQRENGESPALPVWHAEYWDRYIRDQNHFDRTVEYIHSNPVKANLTVAAENWPWSSAYSASPRERRSPD
jgi:REP element-mobilizing transposase RayT